MLTAVDLAPGSIGWRKHQLQERPVNTSNHPATGAADTRAYPVFIGVRLAPDQSQGLALLAKEHGLKTAQMARVLIALAVHDMERGRASEATKVA